jgi:predicted nucleic acid-binding protein
MIRVMLDSNIIISGIVFSGNERKLINTIYSKSLVLILNDYIEIEVESVIRKKFPKQNSILRNLLDLMIVEYTAIPLFNLPDCCIIRINRKCGGGI